MKRKLLLGVILTSILSANSFAMHITHGKLLGHKEWTTGKFFNTSFKEIDKLTIPALQMQSYKMRKAAQTADIGDIVFPPLNWVNGDVQGIVGQDLTLDGQTMVEIRNDSSVSKTYTITSTLTSCFSGTGNICNYMNEAISQDTVTLDANGILELAHGPFATENYSTPGQGAYWIETDIQVDGGTLFESMGDAGNITITANTLKK